MRRTDRIYVTIPGSILDIGGGQDLVFQATAWRFGMGERIDYAMHDYLRSLLLTMAWMKELNSDARTV